jgi:hypothetical protein
MKNRLAPGPECEANLIVNWGILLLYIIFTIRIVVAFVKAVAKILNKATLRSEARPLLCHNEINSRGLYPG